MSPVSVEVKSKLDGKEIWEVIDYFSVYIRATDKMIFDPCKEFIIGRICAIDR